MIKTYMLKRSNFLHVLTNTRMRRIRKENKEKTLLEKNYHKKIEQIKSEIPKLTSLLEHACKRGHLGKKPPKRML
jgi:hypothetical protein